MWDAECQKAVKDIKKNLTSPPVLATPIYGRPFLHYVRAADHALRAFLAQTNKKGHEQVIYYLSRTMIGAKQKYILIEKEVFSLSYCRSENETLPSRANDPYGI